MISSKRGAMVRVTKAGDAWKAEQVWANRQLYAQFSNPVLVNGHIIGLTGGFLVCPPALRPRVGAAGDWAQEVYRLAYQQAWAEAGPTWYDRMRVASAN